MSARIYTDIHIIIMITLNCPNAFDITVARFGAIIVISNVAFIEGSSNDG